MERHIDQQLEKLKSKVIKMGSLVDEQVDLAFQALEQNNYELAQIVINRDAKVDKYDLNIEKICQKIIALNQPVAFDLRLIISALTINSNLERIGDIAVNIAQATQRMKSVPGFLAEIHLPEMIKLVKSMVKNAIDAFVELSPKLAELVIRSDNQLDSFNKNNHGILVEIMKKDINAIEQAVEYLVISRQIERMGDHATNIAEDVYFIVEAQMIKHEYQKHFMDWAEENEEKENESE